jgi:hypothetical protein
VFSIKTIVHIVPDQQALKTLKAENRLGERARIHSSLINPVDTGKLVKKVNSNLPNEES